MAVTAVQIDQAYRGLAELAATRESVGDVAARALAAFDAAPPEGLPEAQARLVSVAENLGIQFAQEKKFHGDGALAFRAQAGLKLSGPKSVSRDPNPVVAMAKEGFLVIGRSGPKVDDGRAGDFSAAEGLLSRVGVGA